MLSSIYKFYHSAFWKRRYYRRLKEEGINVSKYLQALKLRINFKSYWDNRSSNGLSYGTTIELNRNLDPWEYDKEHFDNLIMHEFGHILYSQKEFKQVVHLNNLVFSKSIPLPLDVEMDSDLKYFTDKNEIRQRIIPIIKVMWENKWSANEVYDKICKYDDIFDIYSRELIIYWIENLL